MKKYLIAGNWKMHTDIVAAVALASGIKKQLTNKDGVEVLVCPPFTNIWHVVESVKDSNISAGAQNCYYEEKGAFTGEISVDMIKALGCQYIIVGHSERRAIFKESDELINKKAHAILNKSLKPIICIGETLDERKAEKTISVLKQQLDIGLKEISDTQSKDIVLAYEPVWAIGTGISATNEQIEDAHKFIRSYLSDRFPDNGNSILIQYGGSVKPDNAQEILSIENVNGALIGGASLKVDSFMSIIRAAQSLV
jgi:triosephosphate isomerase (TIM)